MTLSAEEFPITLSKKTEKMKHQGHGCQLSHNAIFLATVHSPREYFCHLAFKQPLQVWVI